MIRAPDGNLVVFGQAIEEGLEKRVYRGGKLHHRGGVGAPASK